MNNEWHWHLSPICVEGYGFKGQHKCYYSRSEPDLVLDIVYTHEGEQVYISGFRGDKSEDGSELFDVHSLRSLQRLLKEQGVLWARWEHHGTQMKWNILTGKISRDTRDQSPDTP